MEREPAITEKSAAPAIRVLLVDDSEDDAQLVLREIRRGGLDPIFLRVQTAAAMKDALEIQSWDVVISDYSMPHFNGLEALRNLTEREIDMPFILISGTIGEEVAVEAMKAGASDYLLKGNLQRLVPAIKREVQEAQTRRFRRETEDRLRVSLREKETLLKEIHHRVKNNLQMVCSLINLLSQSFRDPKNILAGLKDCQNRVFSMAMVHEKLYQSQNFDRINFADYINGLLQNLANSHAQPGKNIKWAIEAEPLLLEVDQAIPCGLIVHELVSNGFKHAFKGMNEGMIRVIIRRETNQYVLIIRDNGKGLPPDFNPQACKSLGMQLVTNLTRQLNGDLHVESINGAIFRITFPVPTPPPSTPN